MLKVPGVSQVHDLHVWTVAPGYIALSAHVTVDDQSLSQTTEVIVRAQRGTAREF